MMYIYSVILYIFMYVCIYVWLYIYVNIKVCIYVKIYCRWILGHSYEKYFFTRCEKSEKRKFKMFKN